MPVWTIPYNIHENEFVELNRHYMLKTPAGRKALRAYRIVFPLLLLILLPLFYFKNYKDADFSVLIVSAVLYAIAAVIWWFNCHRVFLFIFKSRLKKSDSAEKALFSPKGVLTFDFDNCIIIDENPTEEIKIRFDTIECVYETEAAFYFYYNNQAKAVIVPYRLFKSADEYYAFTELVRNNFPAENKK